MAVKAGRHRYATVDYMVRAKLFAGLKAGTMSTRSLFDDERMKMMETPTCVYCGFAGALSADHLISRASGGSDDGNNLVSACRSCNSCKGRRDVMVWLGERNIFPGLMLLRRYLKIVIGCCEANELMDLLMEDPRVAALPFRLAAIPIRYPPPAELRL